MKIFKNKTILITGGTGSFGKNYVKYLLKNSEAKKIIVFSRDELKQFQMQREIEDSRLRFFLGDVRDLPRLERAFHGINIVIHAAALKQIPTLEYNPFEAVKTNIIGSQNVIDAAIDQGVEKALFISSDKAAHPVNLYGSTKLCAEKLFISGNSYAGGKTQFSCVRYGNILGSRGSIVETLIVQKNIDKVYITDERMTRFWITFDQAFNLVLFALENMAGGEIFIPKKIPSMKLVSLFDAICPQAKKEIIGIRAGEKLHEVLLTNEEAKHTVELGDYYVILPEFSSIGGYKKHLILGKKLKPEFKFSSDKNKKWLTKGKLKEMVNELIANNL